jgi:hypothetical protein
MRVKVFFLILLFALKDRCNLMLLVHVFIIIIIIWLYSPNLALAPPLLVFRNNNLFTGLDC